MNILFFLNDKTRVILISGDRLIQFSCQESTQGSDIVSSQDGKGTSNVKTAIIRSNNKMYYIKVKEKRKNPKDSVIHKNLKLKDEQRPEQ